MATSITLLPTWGVIGAVVCMMIGGIANSGITVLLFTAIQLAIPHHLMGRVMGLLMFSSFGLYPLSVALAGVLSNQFGLAILFPFSGLLLDLVLLFGMTQRALREILGGVLSFLIEVFLRLFAFLHSFDNVTAFLPAKRG
ncbi:MAG TPA: hypothetical protein VN954_13865 [Ktedonobacteraceae bacterium]|nr:hypothetical protein [Ktedonobacteraceae bacterium]